MSMYNVNSIVTIENNIYIVAIEKEKRACAVCSFSKISLDTMKLICTLPEKYSRDNKGACPLYGMCYFKKIFKEGI